LPTAPWDLFPAIAIVVQFRDDHDSCHRKFSALANSKREDLFASYQQLLFRRAFFRA
jgi:hypothetical protein